MNALVNTRILRLNKSGFPTAWLTRQEAATLYAKDNIVWCIGEENIHIYGGFNNLGIRSSISMAPIIACEGNHKKEITTPALSNHLLFRRDDHRCMYCGQRYHDRELTRDHVVPKVQGGCDTWNNVVAACRRCNSHKGGCTPEQASMQLLAIPFTPNIFEYMFLANRQILGDQMQYLESRFSQQREWRLA